MTGNKWYKTKQMGVRVDCTERVIMGTLCLSTLFICIYAPFYIFSDASALVAWNPVISGRARINFVLNKTVKVKENYTSDAISNSFKWFKGAPKDDLLQVHVPYKMFENNNLIFRDLTERAFKRSTYYTTETSQFKPEQVQVAYIERLPDQDIALSKDSKRDLYRDIRNTIQHAGAVNPYTKRPWFNVSI